MFDKRNTDKIVEGLREPTYTHKNCTDCPDDSCNELKVQWCNMCPSEPPKEEKGEVEESISDKIFYILCDLNTDGDSNVTGTAEARRELVKLFESLITTAVTAERERCAVIAENELVGESCEDALVDRLNDKLIRKIADAIRNGQSK